MIKCPRCNENKLESNEQWDKEYDRLDHVIGGPDLIRMKLNNKGIPEYICSNCEYEVFTEI
ncbi:hypothetical protein C7B89_19930 [Lysinibacillus capsici]|nr:hypothetical protein C7B89_19930 [Lysinibacillus capsici]